MYRLNNLKIRRKLVAMAFVIIALLIGAMVIVVQMSLGTVRQAFREESDAVVVQMGENIAQTLDAGINSSYQLSSPAFMQALIDRNIKVRGEESNIVEFNVYAPDATAQSGYRLIASNQEEEKGKEADPEDVEAITEDKTVVAAATEDGVPVLDVTAPLHADGKPIAAAGIKLSLTASRANESKVLARTTDQIVRTAGIAGLVAALVALGLSLVISLNITGPLDQAVQMIQDMGKGRLDRRLRIKRTDEIGLMTQAMDQFADDLSGLLSTVNGLSTAAVQGDLAMRADADKYQGDFRKIVQGVNDTLDAVIGPLKIAAEYVDQIGQGQVPPPITDEYRGDFGEIKNSLNACIAGLGGLVESNAVLQRMAVNDYTQRVQGAYQGIYAQVADAINNGVLERLIHIQDTVTHIANGDLRDLEEYKQIGGGTGRRSENDKIVPSIIAMLEAIQRMVGESVALTEAAKAGQLSKRADAGQFKGNFRDVIQGMNETLDAVIGPLTVAAEYVDRISKGEIPAPIADTYYGDFDELKSNLNNMIVYLNEMAQAATEIAGGHLNVQVRPVSERDVLGQAFAQMTTSLQGVVGDIVAMAQKLAAGDLTVTPSANYNGEFVKIRDGLAVALTELNGTLRQTNLVVNQVAQSVAQMQAVSQDLATGAQEQSSAVEEVTSNLEHTDSQVKSSAESANVANQLVVKTAELADAGKQKMKALTGAMGAIASSSHEIGKIIKVIDDIAFQTNLLALNAAVEAARAGQAGRGFAVVAQEVRNLAERSAKAAKSTAELIESSGRQVEEGVKITKETDAALGDIAQNVVTVKDLAGEIAAVSEEESRSLAQISKAMAQVNGGAQSSSAQSEQLASTAEELSGLAEQLRAQIARFQLRQGRQTDGADLPAGALLSDLTHAVENGLPEGLPPDLVAALRLLLQSKSSAAADKPEPPSANSEQNPGPSGNGHGIASLDRDARGYEHF